MMPEDTLNLLSELFRKALNDAFSQAIGAACTVTIADAATPSPEGPSVCYGLTASGGLCGNAFLAFANPEAVWLAQKLLSESSDTAAELNLVHKQAIQDLLTKAATLLEKMLEPAAGATNLKVDPVDAIPSQGTLVTLRVSESDSKAFSVKLHLAPELLTSMSEASLRAQEVKPPTAGQGTAGVASESNLDLLLGVDLNLTLRFGQRTLTLREIMELSSGSIIELDRQVQEPADLLLGDKLIARGEVVIVDGNYGLRITEVADPAPANERLPLHSATANVR